MMHETKNTTFYSLGTYVHGVRICKFIVYSLHANVFYFIMGLIHFRIPFIPTALGNTDRKEVR